jgi:hypothetical protein
VKFGFLRFASLRGISTPATRKRGSGTPGLRRKERASLAHLYGRAEARALTLAWHVDAIWDGKKQASQAGAPAIHISCNTDQSKGRNMGMCIKMHTSGIDAAKGKDPRAESEEP